MLSYKRLFGLVLLLSLSFSIHAKDDAAKGKAANEINAKDQLMCAISFASLCQIYEDCIEGTVETVDLPLLLRINPKKKTIESTRLGGEQRFSTISAVNKSDNNLILQGVQEGSGWSMTINKTNGQMSVSSSLGDQGYVAFGVCTRY
jgi:hypothetical protein